MKLFKTAVMLTFGLTLGLLRAAPDDDGIDNRDLDYGYVQFKLYKEASYEARRTTPHNRAIKPQLDYLAEASKVQVTLTSGEETIVQTLTLSAADAESAEYGMRSAKLKLLTGNYTITRFTLFDAEDGELYNGNAVDPDLTVVAGGLTVHDLTVNVQPRGKVRFTLTKDMSGFNPPKSRSGVSRQYIFEEIGSFDVTVKNTETNNLVAFEGLPVTFSIHFDDPENTETAPGYQTSTCACDSLLSLPAGNYAVIKYVTYDSDGTLLETNTAPAESPFTVEDNRTTDSDVAVTLYEADEYMKDHYALYAIWKALHGDEWSYQGENYPVGSNWDFNKDPDLWSYQPGVEVHTNGRIAMIDISGFGFSGDMPKEIGQLTELVELYLGTHNDTNVGFRIRRSIPTRASPSVRATAWRTIAPCCTPCTRPRRCPGPAPLRCASTASTSAPRALRPGLHRGSDLRGLDGPPARHPSDGHLARQALQRAPVAARRDRQPQEARVPLYRQQRHRVASRLRGAKAARACRDWQPAPISRCTTART